MKSRKFLNIKVGVEFYEALMSKPSFQRNWKAVSPSFYLVNRIAELNESKEGEAVEFYSGTIADIFQPYTLGVYAPFLRDMEALSILQIDHAYELTPNKKGHCKKYKVTDYGCRLIHSANMAYLKALRDDPAVRRQNQKSISKRKAMSKIYEDAVLNSVQDGLKHLSFDYEEAERAIAKSAWSDAQKANVSGILRSIDRKDYDKLEIGAVDGRIHHELVRLKSDARFLLSYKGIPYKAVLDIRCCHCTFFSAYIRSLPLSLHYVTDKGDKASVLEQEHGKWIRLFCDAATEPKEVVRKACGFDDLETAKAAMNQSLNGSRRFPKYLAWLKKEFPTLFEIWQGTDVKDTGNAIARKFEHELIRHQRVYDLAESLGVKIMDEHDGFGVFAKDDGPELESKLDTIKNYLESLSVSLFGVPIVIKPKPVFDWANADLLGEMEHKRDQLFKEYKELKPILSRRQRKYFASNREMGAGQAYADACKKEHGLLLRNKAVIEYWVERE